MQLSSDATQRCANLFKSLDLFVLKVHNRIKPGKVSHDENQLRYKLRTLWQNKPEYVNKFIALHRHLPEEDLQTLQQWNRVRRSLYIVIKYYPEYAVFYSIETGLFFGVLALTNPFSEILSETLPVIVEAALLPYEGTIIWDGLVRVSSSKVDATTAKMLLEACEKGRAEGLIITQ